MTESTNPFADKRKFERRPLQMPAVYIWEGIECPCHVIDISSQGIGMRVKGCLAKGDVVEIVLGRLRLKSTVVRVDGNIIGVTYDLLTTEQLNEIIELRESY